MQTQPYKIELIDGNAHIPVRATEGAAGYDVRSCENVVVPARSRVLVNTGFKLQFPQHVYARIAPRSGLACKGIDVGAGVVDSDYTGVVKVLLINNDNEHAFEVMQGDRIAQIIFEQIETPVLELVDKVHETVRGDNGFGSTGI